MKLAEKWPEMIVKLPNAKVVTFEYEQTILWAYKGKTLKSQLLKKLSLKNFDFYEF